jgi:hypothetical protein
MMVRAERSGVVGLTEVSRLIFGAAMAETGRRTTYTNKVAEFMRAEQVSIRL